LNECYTANQKYKKTGILPPTLLKEFKSVNIIAVISHKEQIPPGTNKSILVTGNFIIFSVYALDIL
jgi:hypothetical protein